MVNALYNTWLMYQHRWGLGGGELRKSGDAEIETKHRRKKLSWFGKGRKMDKYFRLWESKDKNKKMNRVEGWKETSPFAHVSSGRIEML